MSDKSGPGASSDERVLRVLVVDDSAYNRQTITTMIETLPDVEVVGRAANGKDALGLTFDLEPDLITLDLEMPEMDGFAFLRLLMAKRPTPVLIISGYAARENVFRALDLGALDFIAKPGRQISPDIKDIEAELLAKISIVRRLQGVRLKQRADSIAAQRRVTMSLQAVGGDPSAGEAPQVDGNPARSVIAVGSSTGGPPAVQQLLRALPSQLTSALIIAQHMPARFTKAFATRLDRLLDIRVVEAQDGQPVRAGVVYVIPGGTNLGVHESDGVLKIRLVPPERTGVVLTPSADHMLNALSPHLGDRLCVVVLTGMGSDGTEGARVARKNGARVYVEDPATAVMPGMPQSVVSAGLADRALPLERLHEPIVAFDRGQGRRSDAGG